jgi:hypothetical protein
VHTLGKFNTPITSKPPKRPMDMLFCCGSYCFVTKKNCHNLQVKN